jgi:hypothetical protein
MSAMKAFWSPGFIALVLAVGAGAAFVLVRQAAETAALRTELELARLEAADLPALRAENQRRRAQQIPAAELQRLRDDHAALPRLRAELEALRKAAAKQ